MSVFPPQPHLTPASLYGTNPSHQHPITPLATDPNPLYDGLTYRSTLLESRIPAAPPPAGEWSSQSEKCITLVQDAVSDSPSSGSGASLSKDVLITNASQVSGMQLQRSRLTNAHLHSASSAGPQALLQHLTAQLRLCGQCGARFSQYLRFYQYERSGLTMVDIDSSGALLNDLGASGQAPGMTTWPGGMAALPAPQPLHTKIWMVDLLCQTFLDISRAISELRAWTLLLTAGEREQIGGEPAMQSIHTALDYLLHYLNPYKAALTELVRRRMAPGLGGRIGDDDGDV